MLKLVGQRDKDNIHLKLSSSRLSAFGLLVLIKNTYLKKCLMISKTSMYANSALARTENNLYYV